MSFQASLAKLSSPLKALVTGAIQLENGSGDTGKSDKDEADVIEWIEKVAQGDIVKLSGIKVRLFGLVITSVATTDCQLEAAPRI